ncbi:MAG: ribosomal protein L7/L12 [Clostridia bacterium]|nr:ribosomal protein L7/L12 [Clostridia bacterium]
MKLIRLAENKDGELTDGRIVVSDIKVTLVLKDVTNEKGKTVSVPNNLALYCIVKNTGEFLRKLTLTAVIVDDESYNLGSVTGSIEYFDEEESWEFFAKTGDLGYYDSEDNTCGHPGFSKLRGEDVAAGYEVSYDDWDVKLYATEEEAGLIEPGNEDEEEDEDEDSGIFHTSVPIPAGSAEGDGYSIFLRSFGDKKTDVIKVVCDFTGLGYVISKRGVERLGVLMTNLPKDDAEKFLANLKEAGADAYMEADTDPASGDGFGMSSDGEFPDLFDEGERFNVGLKSYGKEKTDVIKVVRAFTGLGHTESRTAVEGLGIIAKNLAWIDAARFVSKLNAAGGDAYIERSDTP